MSDTLLTSNTITTDVSDISSSSTGTYQLQRCPNECYVKETQESQSFYAKPIGNVKVVSLSRSKPPRRIRIVVDIKQDNEKEEIRKLNAAIAKKLGYAW
ncbi:MAG: hypothetical protein ACLP2X_20280 [Syntrophobacteraceae bacterium]